MFINIGLNAAPSPPNFMCFFMVKVQIVWPGLPSSSSQANKSGLILKLSPQIYVNHKDYAF